MILIFSAKMAWLRVSKLPRVSSEPSFKDLEVKDVFRAFLMMSAAAGRLVVLFSSTARSWIGFLTEGHEAFKRSIITFASRFVWMQARSFRGESGCVSCVLLRLPITILLFSAFARADETGPTGIVINQHANIITPKVWLSSSYRHTYPYFQCCMFLIYKYGMLRC